MNISFIRVGGFRPGMKELPPSAFDGPRLREAPGFIGVLFYAGWCGFCRRFLPRFKKAEELAPFPLAIADISSYSDPRWDTFEIRAVPTLILFKAGAPVWRADPPLGVGLHDEDLTALFGQGKAAA